MLREWSKVAVQEWNVVISVNEHGYKRAYDVFRGFGEVRRTEFFNVLHMRAEDVQGMLDALRERRMQDPDSLSFLSRLVPVSHAFIFNSAEEFDAKAKDVVRGWTPRLAGKSFHVRIHRRGFKGRLSSPDEERILDAFLLEELEKSNTPGRIDFNHSDAVIAIETIGTWAGMSLWTREDMKKYPFIRVD